jgi:hypothetical protein
MLYVFNRWMGGLQTLDGTPILVHGRLRLLRLLVTIVVEIPLPQHRKYSMRNVACPTYALRLLSLAFIETCSCGFALIRWRKDTR